MANFVHFWNTLYNVCIFNVSHRGWIAEKIKKNTTKTQWTMKTFQKYTHIAESSLWLLCLCCFFCFRDIDVTVDIHCITRLRWVTSVVDDCISVSIYLSLSRQTHSSTGEITRQLELSLSARWDSVCDCSETTNARTSAVWCKRATAFDAFPLTGNTRY